MSVYEHAALPLQRLLEVLKGRSDAGEVGEIGFRIDRDTGVADEPYVFLSVETSDRNKRAVQQKLEQQFQLVDLQIDRLTLDPPELVSQPGISITAEEIAGGLKVSVVSEIDRYKPETMIQFLNRYQQVIEMIITDPDLKLANLVQLIQPAGTSTNQ